MGCCPGSDTGIVPGRRVVLRFSPSVGSYDFPMFGFLSWTRAEQFRSMLFHFYLFKLTIIGPIVVSRYPLPFASFLSFSEGGKGRTLARRWISPRRLLLSSTSMEQSSEHARSALVVVVVAVSGLAGSFVRSFIPPCAIIFRLSNVNSHRYAERERG